MIFLIMNFTALFNPQMGMCESIQEIIDNSNPDSTNQNESISKNTNDNFFAIQIGTFFNESDANEQVIKLKSKGLEPYIFQSVNSKGTNVYAARIGKYDSYSDASSVISQLEDQLNIPLIITHFDSLKPASSSSVNQPLTTKSISDTQQETPVTELADDDFVYTGDDVSLKALMQKINEMEIEIQNLKGESEIRSQLQITEEESKAEEEDILEAAGREYTLTKQGTINLSYGISYSYSAYDAIREGTQIEDVANHTISNRLNVSYGLKDNLSVGVGIPFIYKYHKVGTIEQQKATDLGNLGLSWRLQPFKSNSDLPSIILNGSFSVPVGRSPYEIQVGEELSTSSGIYNSSIGVSVSQVSDPVVVFSSLSVSYPFATQSINQKRDEGILDEVDPGMGIGASVGLGYALSYKLNLNLSFSYSYSFETTYKYQDATDATSGTSTGASMSIGTGYKLSQNQNLNFSIGIPITSSRSFSLSLSTPIDFAL
jgi:hypothetical protein